MRLQTMKAFLLGLVVVGGCNAEGAGDGAANGSGDGSGEGQGDLSTAEREGVAFVREEEKLARDVYAALEEHDDAFATIGDSEQSHMDAVEKLLERYDVADPAAGKEPGHFTNPVLQSLHDALVERGSPSRTAALAVGVEIEELDIADIEDLKEDVTHQDILQTYDNLTRGSRNHLRSFYGKLIDAGGTYEVKHLDQATFDAIVTSPVETGGR